MNLVNQIQITGRIISEQGNKKGRNNWLKKLYWSTKFEEVLFNSVGSCKVKAQLVTEDEEINELLSRIVGDVEIGTITFPLDDVPELPKCNGFFDRTTGLITHDRTCALPVHRQMECQ